MNNLSYDSVANYIRDTIIIVKMGPISNITTIEYKRNIERLKVIEEYFSTHIIFYKYVMGKISLDRVSNLVGLDKNKVNNYLSSQRKLFIRYISEEEDRIEHLLRKGDIT